jgi:phage tail sheath protein FI
MAEQIVSPGVFTRENDQSFITQQPVQVGAAIVGPTVKGPVEIPTVVTSYSQYVNKFGTTFVSGNQTYSYLTSISAYNYFQNGGTTLLVTRVVSKSADWTSAISTTPQNNVTSVTGRPATGSFIFSNVGVSSATGPIGLKINYNNANYYFFSGSGTDAPASNYYWYTTNGLSGLVSEINASASAYFSASFNSTTLSISASFNGTAGNGITVETGSFTDLFLDTTDTQVTLAGGVDAIGNAAFTLKTISEGTIMNSSGSENSAGALTNGTSDNVRWEISQANTGSGTFTLLIRRGDDVTNEKVILETFANISLDPEQDNYIAKIVGDTYQQVITDSDGNTYVQSVGNYPNNSNYVYVASITPTPNYFDNNGTARSEYTTSIPILGSGSFTGGTGNVLSATNNFYENIGTNTQGLVAASYTTALSLLANKEEYSYKVITAPGLLNEYHASPLGILVTNTQNRGDAIAVVDLVRYGATISETTTQAGNFNSSYAATYWPWAQIFNPDTGKINWVPASTLIPGVYAANDASAEPWFAPAGINRGGLAQVIRPERKLQRSERDTLYEDNVNPIATFPATGPAVFGQKTLQRKASALDRVNVRRLLIELKSFIGQVANNLVFEQNTAATRNSFLAQVNPYLESVQQRQGVYAFKVVMDDSNNTPDVIDRNQLVGQIFIQPTRTAEFIVLDFNILPTGAEFPA